MMRLIAVTAVALLLAACQTTGDGRATTATPAPPPSAAADPSDVIAATRASIVAGMGIIDRQIFSARSADDLPTHQRLVHNGFLPNGGFTTMRSLWRSSCGARGGEWRSPVCWAPGRDRVLFLAETFPTGNNGVNDKMGLYVLDPKPNADQEKFLAAAAADLQTYTVLKFSANGSRLSKMQRAEAQLDGLAAGFPVVPGFREAAGDELESRLAALALLGALNERQRNADQYLHGADIAMSIQVVKRSSAGGDDCADVRATRVVGRQASATRDLKSALTGDNGSRTARNTLCRRADDRDGLTWNWVN